MVPKRSSILVICVAAALALSGCAGQQLSDDQEQRVAEKFEERVSEIDGYHATVTTSVTYDNQSSETTADVWARTETGELRQEVLAPESRAGSRVVSNGSVMWVYNAAENTATRMDVPKAGNHTALVPRVSELVERYDIFTNGTVTLDGTETHKLTLVPNESTVPSVSGTITMWVETDRMFPVKMSMEFDQVTSTIRYENLTLNPDFEPGTFEFERPENATVRESQTPNVTEFQSHENLAAATDRPIPDADLPDGFGFESGSLIDGETTVVSLTYTDGENQLSVTVTENRSQNPRGETVPIGDRTGTYSEFGDRASLSWTCNGSSYTVFGQFEKETLTDIAAEIGC